MSVFGLFGILAAAEEGLEINFLGLTFGVDPLYFSLKAPFVGRIGAGVTLLLAAVIAGGMLAFRR